jgi:membrane associated rhomboid family serine protease
MGGLFITEVVKKLLLLNIGVYFIVTVFFPTLAPMLAMHYPFEVPNLPPAQQVEFGEFAATHPDMNIGFMPLQLVTYMFMHANANHLIMNMIGLMMFGPLVEAQLGQERFLIYYLLTGFGALGLHIGLQWYDIHSNPDLTVVDKFWTAKSSLVGASGAIFGITAALGFLMPKAEFSLIFLPMMSFPAWLMVAVYIAIEIYHVAYRPAQDGVAHWAHLGGALFGLIILLWWSRRSFFK